MHSYFRNLNVLKDQLYALERLTPRKEPKDKVYNQLRSHNVGPAALVTKRIGVLALNPTLLIHSVSKNLYAY